MKYSTHYQDEQYANLYLNYMLKNANRVFKLVITDDNDESYIPNLNLEYGLCDCKNGEDFTLGKTWEKYFDGYDNKPVVFINTSHMFKQFELKASKNGINKNGASLFACYLYLYRDKMWKEQRTKFIFIITESNLIEMLNGTDAGLNVEFTPIYIKKDNIKIKEKKKC